MSDDVHVQSSLMKTSTDESFSSCDRSDGSDIASAASSLVSNAFIQLLNLRLFAVA